MFGSRFRTVFACAFALMLGTAISACGGPQYTQIGEAGDQTVSVLVENGIGEAITAFSVRDAGAEAYPASLLDAETIIAADETVQLNYAAADGALYDLALTGESGTLIEVANVPLAELESFSVRYEDGVGFFVYTDGDGNEISSKEAALEAKAAAEKLAADTEAAQAVADIVMALPAPDAIVLDSESAIVAARAAYEGLDDDQKELFPAEALAALEGAEAALKAAQEQEAARIAAEEEAARIAAEEAAAAAAAAEESYYYDDSYSYSYDYSAPTQSTEDCTSDTIVLRP